LREYLTKSDEETVALGRQLSKELPPKATVLLIGNLGAGKTTLAKGIIQGRGAAAPEDVSSPTFTLIHEYGSAGQGNLVYHIDLYRLDSPREIATLGLDEIFDRDALVLIEWGERFPQLMPADRYEIHLTRLSEDERRIEVHPPHSLGHSSGVPR
jgi:tRNA threonylcarbamoyladenosine biosynthesis protein TsaE